MFRHAFAIVLVMACSRTNGAPAETATPQTGREDTVAMQLTITSTAFANLEAIPTKFTCEGQNLSPELRWEGVPANARSLALVVDDPDAPDPANPRQTFVHWVVYDLPPTTTGLPEGVQGADLPAGARVGTNDWRKTEYGGPCPPIGRHRYFHKLFALDVVLGDLGAPTKQALEVAMQGHVVARGELVGTYEKTR
jgi:hypothetical protein